MATIVIGGRTKKVRIRAAKTKKPLIERFKDFFKKRAK